ncbi:pectate lyase-like adhesive domain-containing protein [Hominenteromicrobium mulieris]|uniref:pectate lyase-like adhesive domain-containing protein n=1 Tax=Hominenteromicrobium mulieris TaxID=2885357 RepID=UPI00376F9378
MKKRLFSILLALCMVLCLVPTTAFAESETEEPPVCSCETACTAEAMNADCPICGAEGALPENCAKCAQPADDAVVQPEGEVSDPQPEAALTALSGEGETPAASGAVTDVSTAADLTAAIANPDVNTVRLAANIDISNTLTVNRTVTLDLNGYALTVGGTELDIFSVDENGNLTVKDSGTGGKIDGQNKNCGFCIYGGVLTLESGTITNCTTDGDGGAVDISDGGKFEMSGGAITNCKASDDSGAVDIGKGCTFIMNSGTISGCRADDDAGAIFIKGNASFVMNGGTIENCSAGFCGGAVKIRNTSSFTMTGGTISNCTAQQGGGVYVDDSSTFNMNGGSIANCTAVNGGNSVFVMSGTGGKFTMTDGTVDGSVTLHFTVAGSDVYMDGLGTAAYPYQISTADQLKLFRDIVNGTGDQAQNRGAYAVLTANIDLNNEPWTPIGNYTEGNQIYYEGTFDGGGYTISGLNVTGKFRCASLFGAVKGGTIKNLTVAGNVSHNYSSTGLDCHVGGIVGSALDAATIENCSNNCSVTGGSGDFIGGIAGSNINNARIIDCYNVGTITGTIIETGGVTGFNMGTISNCYNVGTIKMLHNSNAVGEIVGNNVGTVKNCYYLAGTNLNAVGQSNNGSITKTESKTAADFANDTVLALLKAGERDNNADPWADECKYLDAAGKTLPVFNGQGDAHDHQSNDWKSNETEHWQVCTCGAVFHKAQHSGGTATCTQRATCTVCGAEYGDALGHDFTTSWTHDDNEHWKQCSRCDKKDDVSPHTWDNGTITTAPTCTKAGEETYSCTKCDATKIEPIPATGHSWKSDWTSDATHHWHECDNKNCDVTDNAGKNGYAEHSGGKATCKAQAVCEICKAGYGNPDQNNHTDLKHVDAKAATAAEEGNIAYWYCDGCKKYFSDAAATKEITKAATVTAKLPPKITAGDGAAVTQGEKKELTFTSDASFADFVRVELDGTALEEKNYTKREGSTIITLNRDFVAALSVGEHTLAIVSQHGTATAKFTVKAKPTETAIPQPTVTPQPTPTVQPQPTVQPVSPILRTGDTSNLALWIALLFISGGAAIGITVASRKKKHNK